MAPDGDFEQPGPHGEPPAWPPTQPPSTPDTPQVPPGPGYPPETPGYPAPAAYGQPGPYGSANPYGYGYGYGYGAPPQRTDVGAIISLILSIAGVFFCLFSLCSVAFGGAAIVVGVISRRNIRNSGGTLTGDPLALTGIIIGSIEVAIAGGLMVLSLVMLGLDAAT